MAVWKRSGSFQPLQTGYMRNCCNRLGVFVKLYHAAYYGKRWPFYPVKIKDKIGNWRTGKIYKGKGKEVV